MGDRRDLCWLKQWLEVTKKILTNSGFLRFRWNFTQWLFVRHPYGDLYLLFVRESEDFIGFLCNSWFSLIQIIIFTFRRIKRIQWVPFLWGLCLKSYRSEGQPRSTRSEFPSRGVFGNCRLFQYGGLYFLTICELPVVKLFWSTRQVRFYLPGMLRIMCRG